MAMKRHAIIVNVMILLLHDNYLYHFAFQIYGFMTFRAAVFNFSHETCLYDYSVGVI